MPNVASDPVVPRPLRPEPISGRAGATTASSGAFEGLLETASPEPPRADRPQRAGRNRSSEPIGAAPNPTKPAATPTPRHGEKSEVSETGQPTAQPAEAALATTETVSALALEFAAAAADAACEPAPKIADADAAVTVDPIADAGDTLPSAATDGTTTELTPATIVAVIAPAPAPANTPAAAPALDPATVAAVDIQAGLIVQTKAAAQAPVDPIDQPATADTAKPQAASNAAAEASVDEARPSDDSQKAAVLKSAGPSDSPEAKSPARSDRNAAPGQVKPEHHGAARPADAPTPRDAAPPADVPAEPKAPAPQHPQAQAREHTAPAAHAAAADAHPELPATVAAPAQLNASAPPPFNPAAHIPAPLAVSPLAAFHVDIAADNAMPVAGLAVEIVARAHDGLRRFEIRLDPPELGRIDVRLDVDHGGKVTSRLIVERAETLDLLRRDAPQLERALQQAGLNTEGGLEFSLRDQNFANRERAPGDGSPVRLIVPDDEAAAAEAARRGYGRMIGLGGGVDIRV